ncbi:thiamine pyrophosphate-dependent enzyme, partial [Klebsiella pneumoniae]
MLSKQALLQAYRKMREIRTFEERLHQENTSGDIPGFIHLYTGEEAIAVGVCENLTSADFIGSTHRGHGHCIAKEGANKQVISSQADSLIKISRIWA